MEMGEVSIKIVRCQIFDNYLHKRRMHYTIPDPRDVYVKCIYACDKKSLASLKMRHSVTMVGGGKRTDICEPMCIGVLNTTCKTNE